MDFLLWAVFPYLCVLILIVGLVWRYRFDKFGWTTRSSQVYESSLLKFASPLFHYSLIAVIIGHAIGLFIPKAFTDQIGISQETYHLFAAYGGSAAGIGASIGLVLLIWRRRSNQAVFRATTANDKIMFLLLAAGLGTGFWAILSSGETATGDIHNYRETVSVWFRSLFVLQPDVEAMSGAPISFWVHVAVGLLLTAAMPFTRLIHAFSAPIQYLFRPYIVYRSRDSRDAPSRTVRGRGWEPITRKYSEKTKPSRSEL